MADAPSINEKIVPSLPDGSPDWLAAANLSPSAVIRIAPILEHI